MTEGQITLLTEPKENPATGYQSWQFNLVQEGAEWGRIRASSQPTDFYPPGGADVLLAPGTQPRQFYLVQEGAGRGMVRATSQPA